jgi:SAM-dependent methyltransferase
VDWPTHSSQQLRFACLLKVCDFRAPFSLNDLGCGYGALLEHLDRHHPHAHVDYLGIDVSREMVDAARALWRRRPFARFRFGHRAPRVADYAVASGIFNVKLDASQADWEELVRRTLRDLHATSLRGFAVNFIAPPSRGQQYPPQLYACDPQRWRTFCRDDLGRRVRIVANYGLPEFTLLALAR